MNTTPAEYAALNAGECQNARKMTKHVYIIKHATPNSSTEYSVMTESEAKSFFGGGVIGFSASMLNRVYPENYSEMNVPQIILDQLK